MKIHLRLAFVAFALATLPGISYAHGTDRHYGNPFGRRAAPPASPQFSLMLIESSLSSIRRSLETEDTVDMEERIDRIRRSTANLLRATSGNRDGDDEFAAFERALDSQSPVLLGAARQSAWHRALAALEALEASFTTSKRLYRSRNPDL